MDACRHVSPCVAPASCLPCRFPVSFLARMSNVEHTRYMSRLPWAVVIAGWVVFCCVVVGLLYGWHANERRACERQASGLARTLAATLRTMSRRVTESKSVLLEVLEETVGAATLTGIALTDSAGRPAAAVGLEPAMLARTGVAPEGVLFLPEQALEELNLVAAGLAHEIKNPLGVIRGTAQRLCGTGVDG